MEIDIYIPFYSNPGLPAEDLKQFTINLEGSQTVKKEVSAILKQGTLMARKDTVKGRKDLADLISLFQLPDFNWKKYKEMVKKYKLDQSQKTVSKMLKKTTKMDELDLNVHQMARLKNIPILS